MFILIVVVAGSLQCVKKKKGAGYRVILKDGPFWAGLEFLGSRVRVHEARV